MNINDLDFFLVRIEHDAESAAIPSLLVRLVTDSGVEGWGDARIGWRAAELSARRDVLLSVLVGRSIFDVEELLTLDVLREPALRSALETASWDLIGRTVGEPLCHLLGGQYRRQIPLAARIAGPSPGQTAHLARELAEQGFHTQIVRSGGRPEEDAETLHAVRRSVGDRTRLRLDGAASYDLATARELCGKLERDDLEFFLDPLDTPSLDELASLGRQTSAPLAVSRAIRTPADVLAAVRCGAGRFVVIDLERVGGIVPARKCAAVAEAAGLGASLGIGPSPGPGVAALLHLAAATPSLDSCNQCACHQLHDDLLTEPLEIVDGMITVPQSPGLGVDVDRAKIEQYAIT